jgi:hypothetical protein
VLPSCCRRPVAAGLRVAAADARQRSSYAAEQGALLAAHVDLARALGGGWRGASGTPVSALRKDAAPLQ